MQPEHSRPDQTNRVLVVDPDIVAAAGLTTDLNKLGIVVRHLTDCPSPSEESIAEFRPSLVILDPQAAKSQGLQLLTHLKQGATPTPVIIWTNDDDRDNMAKLLDMGADFFLSKVAPREELLNFINITLQ